MESNIANFLLCSSYISFISFDVFDTLLFRTFPHYTDVFEMVEALYNASHDEIIKGFKINRVKAESAARRIRGGKEVTLDMIYQQVPYNIEIRAILKDIEMQCEIDNCVPNEPMISFLNECRAMGKRIVITTDMYLPRNVFERILEKIDVKYDYLFISGEEGVTKRSGELFPVVLTKLGINASQIVHIGDDPNNDIAMPKKYGISSYERIQNKTVELPYSSKSNDIYSSHINSFLRIGLQRHTKMPEVVLGYTIIGPMMWEFCEWIHKIKEEEQLERILFVAREGWLIMKCYNEMYPEDKDIISYIRLNKNLLRLPSLKHGKKIEKFIRSIPGRSSFSWNDILSYLGVKDIEEFTLQLSKHFPERDFKSYISNKELREDKNVSMVLEYALTLQEGEINDQYNMLLEYLKINDVVPYRVGLVNNSINGSGQSLIEDFIAENGEKCNIYGIQFVRSKKCIDLLSERSVGWLNEHRKVSFDVTKFSSNCLYLEHLLFEPQGTALRFVRGVDGMVNAVCEEPRTEKQDFKVIGDVQKYALLFITEFKRNVTCPLDGIGFDRYLKMLLNPVKKEALFLASLWDDDIEQDRQLLNLKAKFKPINCLLKQMPENTSWIEGWFAINDVPQIYKYLVRLRQLVRYYRHHNIFVGGNYS